MKNLKFALLPILAAGTILGACGNNNSTSSGPAPAEPLSGNQAIVYEATTAVGLLGQYAPSVYGLVPAAETATDFAEMVKDYLPSIEMALLSKEGVVKSETVASDREEYATLVNVTYTDSALESQSFKLYYNETMDIDQDDDEDEEYIEGKEVESIINGIVVTKDGEYQMRGEKEIDGEEAETNFSYFINETTYISVAQEIESGEEEFDYEVYENGKLTYQYSIERETEENQPELEVVIKENGKTIEAEFEVVKNKDDALILEAEIKIDDKEITAHFQKVIDSETGEATWEIIK